LIPFHLELLKGEGEDTPVYLLLLHRGLSTTPSSIGAFEKSMVEKASSAEKMKNPLLFTRDGPGFTDPNDSMFVSTTKNDSNMVEHDCSTI
jgi:hypothetical protein